MYKFTNGIVVFDEKTKNDYLRAGFRLIEDSKKDNEPIEGQISVDEAIKEIEEENGDKSFAKESKRSSKTTRKI